MSDTKGPKNFPREGEHNMVTQEHVEQLQSERPDQVEELHYTIVGRIEAAIHSNLNAENSHQPVRRRERKQQRFKSSGSAKRFPNIQSSVYNTFYVQRRFLSGSTFKRFRTDAFNVWESASAVA